MFSSILSVNLRALTSTRHNSLYSIKEDQLPLI